METQTYQADSVKLKVGDRLWDFTVSVDNNHRLVVEPVDWDEFEEAHPDGMVVEVFGYTYEMYPFQ